VRTINVIERPSDLTAEWLTASVGAGAVADYGYERIGTGQMSECYRVALSYADGMRVRTRSCSRSRPPIR
jgi:hypothetical protein